MSYEKDIICEKFLKLLKQIKNKKKELVIIKRLKTPSILFEYALNNNQKYIYRHVVDDIIAWLIVYIEYIRKTCIFIENIIKRGIYILSSKSIKKLSNDISNSYGVMHTINVIYTSLNIINENINRVYDNIEIFKFNDIKPKHILKTTQTLNETMFEVQEISLKSLKKLTKCIHAVLCDYIPI